MSFLISILMMFMSHFIAEKSDFTITKAESQHFAGGTVWSDSGANYHIELTAERRLINVKFLSVWVGKKRYTKLSALFNNLPLEFTDIDRGETVIVKFTALQQNRPDRESGGPEIDIPDPSDMEAYGDDTNPPFSFSGEALICYLERGQRKYLEIPVFTKLSPQLRP